MVLLSEYVTATNVHLQMKEYARRELTFVPLGAAMGWSIHSNERAALPWASWERALVALASCAVGGSADPLAVGVPRICGRSSISALASSQVDIPKMCGYKANEETRLYVRQ